MDFIKELGITLLVGGFTVLGAEAVLHYFFNLQLSGFFQGKLGFEEKGNVTIAIFIAFAFAVGIVVEDLSFKYRDSNELPFKTVPAQVLGPYMVSMLSLPEEVDDRTVTLIADLNGVMPSPNPLAFALADNNAFQITDTSNYSNNRRFEISRTNSGARVERWILNNQRCIPGARWQSDCPTTTEITNAINTLYYYAKNSAYAHSEHHEELRRIQTRLEFTRSMSMIAFVYFVTALLMAIALLTIHFFRLYFSLQKLVTTRRLGPQLRGQIATEELRLKQLMTRIPIVLIILVVIYLSSLWAFGLETENFNRRAYGYFSTMLISQKRAAVTGQEQQQKRTLDFNTLPSSTPVGTP